MKTKEQTKRGKKTIKEKRLKLLPTLREKRHYLVIEVENVRSEEEARKAVSKAILDFIGIYGYAKAGPLFVETGKINREKTQENFYTIVSATTKYVDLIKASLALVMEPRMTCIGVSGTIKKSRRFLR
ncbi:MAG: ribonuclease P [Candidatus Pacearchaeota archaeon]|nr:ribonuclease P [Candidatus Pacearchaeota archaeon]